MRALIADDHAAVRAGISHLLLKDPRFRLVAETRTANETVDACSGSSFNVVLLDSRLPDNDCAATVRRILAAAKQGTRILLLLEDHDEILLVTALKLGAYGAVRKSDTIEEMVEAAYEVSQGRPYLSRGATDCLIRQLHNGGLHDLAPRELEVVRLVAMGKSNKEIATAMNVSEGSVKKFRARAMKKLGTRSTAELLNIAAGQGWIQMGRPEKRPESV